MMAIEREIYKCHIPALSYIYYKFISVFHSYMWRAFAPAYSFLHFDDLAPSDIDATLHNVCLHLRFIIQYDMKTDVLYFSFLQANFIVFFSFLHTFRDTFIICIPRNKYFVYFTNVHFFSFVESTWLFRSIVRSMTKPNASKFDRLSNFRTVTLCIFFFSNNKSQQ